MRGRGSGAPYAVGPDSIGWGIAGAGRHAAPRLLDAIRSLPPRADGSVQAHVVAVHSHAAYRAQAFAEQNAIAHWAAELDELLARPAVRSVYVANHPRHHAETVQAALQAGKQVLCEPPLALTQEEAEFLRHSALDRGLTLALHYQHRVDPALLTLRQWLRDHDLGSPIGGMVRNTLLLPPAQQTWRVDASYGGILLDRTLRTVDAVRFLFGGEIARVAAAAGPHALGPSAAERRAQAVEDLHSLLTLDGTGAVVQAHDSYLAPHAPPQIVLFGASRSAAVLPWNADSDSPLYLYRSGEVEPVAATTGGRVNLWALSIVAFQEAVRAGAAPPATATDDVANLGVCEALLAAAHDGVARTPRRPAR